MFLEFLGIYQDVEVQASRNIVNTKKFQKIQSWWRQNHVNTQKFQKFQSFPHYSPASTPGRIPAPEAYSLKNFRFLKFLGIRMLLAPSASEFWEFLGIDQDLEVQASRNIVNT